MYLAVAVYFSEACSVIWFSTQWISSAVHFSGFLVQCSAADGSDRDSIGVTGRQREPSALLQNITNTFQGIVQGVPEKSFFQNFSAVYI